MKRKDFQELATIRLREAKALLKSGSGDGAYYLAGYAVECAFKACIAKLTQRHDFPPDRGTVEKIYRHKPEDLAEAAGLKAALRDNMKQDAQFEINWNVAAEWNERSRYERHGLPATEELIRAIEDSKHGVLAWLKRYW